MTRALPPALARGLVFLWLVALLLGAVALGVGLGAVAVPPEAVVRALLGLEENPIVTELRLPRVLAGVLVGAALGVSGAAFQGLFRNPLADPYLMGSASGAAFAVTLFASLLGAFPAFSQHAVFQHLPLSATFFGFVGPSPPPSSPSSWRGWPAPGSSCWLGWWWGASSPGSPPT